MNTVSQKKSNLLNAYLYKPSIRFEQQHQLENIELLLRAHPITQVPWLISGVMMLILLFFLNLVMSMYIPVQYIWFINIFIIAVVLSYFWFNFLGWYFNVGIITSERVVDVDFSSVIYREITTATLGKVEDVTARSGGFLASIIDYGNVFVQTAGTDANIEFLKIPHPSQVANTINQAIETHSKI